MKIEQKGKQPRPPCRQEDGSDCPHRAIGCQANCAEYKAFRQARTEYYDIAQQTFAKQDVVYAYQSRAIRKTKKRLGKN